MKDKDTHKWNAIEGFLLLVGWEKQKLAEKLGVSASTISRWGPPRYSQPHPFIWKKFISLAKSKARKAGPK